MKKRDQNANEDGVREKGKEKKPYSKPEFRHEKVFETMALACGKITSSPGCKFSSKRHS